MLPSILSIGIANPEHTYTQEDILQFMERALPLSDNEKQQLKVLYRATGIHTRYSVLGDFKPTQSPHRLYPTSGTLGPFPGTAARMEVYKSEAIKIAMAAASDCLSEKATSPSAITHLITVSCTGMYAPGLDIDLVNRLGMNKGIERTAINFMGCYAAITGLKHAKSICLARPEARVLLICTELCSLHFQKGTDQDTLLANALFADGAAAVLVQTSDEGLSLENFHCDILPDGSSDMAWELGNFGFEMKLSAYVPGLIERGIGQLTKKLTGTLSTNEKPVYAIHPGGRGILKVIEKTLGMSKEDNFFAYEVLKNYGNMSSPTVLYVLKSIMDQGQRLRNRHILSFAFGPGLTLEAMLLKIRS